jgi:DNA ligase-1
VASFYDLATVCQALAQTQSRLQMAQLVGEFLARLDADEAEIAARFMVGRALPQGDETRLNVSGRALWRIAAEIIGSPEDAAERGEEIFASAVDFGEAIQMLLRSRPDDPEPTLTIGEVNRRFAEIAAIEGRNSRRRKLDALRDLLARASALEAKYIAKILIREMRHGMNEGVMAEAIAKMAACPIEQVRRALMLEGDVGRVVRELRGGAPTGATAPARIKPLKPMLAQTAQDVAEAFAIMGGGGLALEHKVDGARVQIHRRGGEVKIFSRRLNEITPSLPEIVETIGSRLDRDAILDGEVIAVDSSGRPAAFQELMRRFRRVREIDRLRAEQPIRLFVFDLLAENGTLLIDRPYHERFDALTALADRAGLDLIGRMIPASVNEGEKFFHDAVAAGYEGVMAKAMESRYTPGVRGRGWLKIKHTRTLDLVIVAADWGYGRRHGWLSNYHLAARGEQSGEYAEVGKTFKGPTDEQFADMTERLLALKTGEQTGTVFVRPELVVEVAYNDIQRSPQYETGMALRFARIVRLRDDKAPDEADTIATMAEEFERQVVRPLSTKDRL